MSSDVILFCEHLKLAVGNCDTKQASIYLDAIDQYFNDRVSENEIDLAVERVFREDGGVLGFLKLCIGQCKVFRNENIKSFDLFSKIIELHPNKVTPYATNVVIICLQYIRSMQTSARESEKAAIVIEKLVVKNCCDSVDRCYLMSELLKIVEQSKSGTVQCRIFELIGCFAKDYPDCIENVISDGIKIRDMYFRALEKVVINKQDSSMVSLTGAFNGLNDFLENFGPSEEHKEDFAKRVYKCIKPIAKPLDNAQKIVNRSALNLLAHRCELFGVQIFDDFFFWHDLLVNIWLKMDQFDNRRPAIHLLHAIHREVAVHLLQSSNPDRCRVILTFLQTYFKTTLESPKSQAFEIRLAIVGFGLLAAPCKKLLSSTHLDELLSLVMQRTKCIANAVNHNSKEQLEHFPDYVEALSRIMEQVHHLSSAQLNVLQDIIVSVIRNFHLLSTAMHDVTINTLMRTFHNLNGLGDSILDDILEKVVFHGVIWTCSHKLPFDAKNDWDIESDWKDHITYNSYLPLWNGFLADIESNSYNRSAIVSKIYDQMMRTLFKILDKLNFSLRKRIYRDDDGKDQELFFSNPNYDLEPERVKDFHIFFNLIEFYRAMLKSRSLDSHKTHFSKWINQFVDEVIAKSLEHPLVSGFVGLMQIILGITNRLNYFGNDLYESNATSYNNVYYYLSTTIRKAQQSSGELQIACLKLLFTTPTCMLHTLISEMITVFQMAFELGKSNSSLFIAEMALSTIERYMASANLASNETKQFLHEVLPYFDTYLQGFKNDSVQTVEISSHRLLGAKRTAQKLIKVKENDLLKFQKRIILFLGTVEPEYCSYLVKDSEYTCLVKWNTSETVKLTLYSSNFNPRICLDSLIPRICEIATSTTDRQKKLTACEIIQATILYLIGTYNHRGKLWSELCKLMLELASNPDMGVQQMFEPLVMQTMHYMSKDDQLHHSGTEILLKCLMDAISHPTKLAVRDLASRSLREFLSWTIRQSRPEQLAASPFNIVTLIHHLKMFNSDTLHQRRFGAALAFNNIYRVLREEEFIVDKYGLDLLHDFCINLKLSEQQLEESVNCQTDLKQVLSSLDHVLRVLRERKQVFNTLNPDRIRPIPFADSTLRDAVFWLLGQCNSVQTVYRKKMMEMFMALAPCVEGYNSSAAFIHDTQTIETKIKFCENGIEFDQMESADFGTTLTWLRRLHAALECHIWFIENNFILTWKSAFENSRIFQAIEYYANQYMNHNLFEEDHNMDSNSIVHKEKINTEKSEILILICHFLNKTMAIGCVPDAIWELRELIWIIETSVFHPQFLECDTRNPGFRSNLSKYLETFITNINRFGPDQFRIDLNNKLVGTTIDIYQSLSNSIEEILSRGSISASDTNNVNGIDLMCRLIRSKHVPLNESLTASIDVLTGKLLYQIFDGIKEKQGDILFAKALSPDTVQFTSRLLQVCFHKIGIYVNVIDLLLNTTQLKLFDSIKPIKYGRHFSNLYKTIIYQFFLKHVDIIVERLVSKILPPNVDYVLRMLIEITEEAYKTGSKNIVQMKSLTNILLSKWPDILTRSKSDQSMIITLTLIELVGQIAMICPYPLTEISQKANGLDNWLLNIINCSDFDLEIKIQAIFLIPCLIGPSSNEHADVQNALEQFQRQYFPLRTEELRSGSVDRTSYENALQVVLDTMCASKSSILLRFVINCTSPDAKHIFEHKIVESLRKFMAALQFEHQLHCLNVVFEMFISFAYDPSIRMVLIKRFLSHMILNSAKKSIIDFYAMHIRTIEQLLEAPYGLVMPDFKLEQAFTSRIGAFELLETLIMILTREEICEKTCPIVIAKFGDKVQKGNELLAWMSHKAVSTKTESFQTNDTKKMEMFRLYQCAAFKALCAIISNTQSQLKFYENWIFIEKNWWNMINTIDSNLYINQTLEVDKRPQIKERMVSIRRLKNQTDGNTPHQKYIESQTVFESSLSQDVTKIDLSCSYVRTAEEVHEQNRLANYQPKTLMLEKNSINDHEVMATICAVIEHMFENGITPINDDGTVRRQKLTWVESLYAAIANKNSNVHINVRIFLVTAVDNCCKWFQNYADVMTPAILKFLIDWMNMRNNIDALTIFLTVDLLEWDSVYRVNTPDEQQLASDLMTKLMERAFSQQKSVFRRNLEIIRNLMEKWRDFIRLPYRLLFEKISDTNIESKSNICGIHLNGIVLANGLVPFTDESKLQFMNAISNCLNNIHSDVYQPAAQVLGMMLHEIIDNQNGGNINGNEVFINGIIGRLKDWKKTNEKKFMYIIFYIDKHFIINEFLTSILSLIPTSSSDVKKFYLQMFLARVNESDARDIEIILIDLLNQLQEHQHQLIGLHIFNKALPKLSIHQIKSFFPRIVTFQDAKQTESRDLVYEIMKYIRDKYRSDEELHEAATNILLKGLNDMDNDLQSSVYNYWNQAPELSSALNVRALYMLRHLYNRDFLKYGVQLLIDLKSPSLKQKLLRDRAGDEESKYTEYEINVHWKSQDSSLRVPLFTESQQKQILNGEIDLTHSYLRATPQSLLFDPTLDPSLIHKDSSSFSLQSQNSFQFDVSPQKLDRRSQFVRASQASTRTKFSYLRERILRNSNQVSREKALNAVRQRNYRRVQESQQQQRKAGQVTLYRRYRFGDYPDFFINSLAFLLPLQMLVKLDAILARNTFVTILNAVYHELDDDQRHSFLGELGIIVENIIKHPSHCDSMLFSALTEITLTNSAPLNIDPGITTAIPNSNDMMINGILLLENRLINSPDANGQTWAELAEIYYVLSEYDIAASIFSDKIKSDRILSTAIEYESNGDFLNALKSYMEIVKKTTDAAQTDQFNKHADDYCHQFSFNSIFNCFEVMGRWEDLEKSVIGQLTDDHDEPINFEQLWTDEWNVKYLLPHYIRSELRTLIYTETNSTRTFLANIQQWLRNSERADFIKRQFGEELMILHIANKDHRQAKVFSNQYFEHFLDEWSSMSILSEKVRNNKLMNARRVAEIHKYADLLGTSIDDGAIAELCDRWRRTRMNQIDSTPMWESLVAYRIFVTEQALEKYTSKTDPIVDRLIQSMFDMQFKLNEIALQQHNIELSNSILGRLSSFRRVYGKNTTKSVLQYELATIRHELIKCANQKQDDQSSEVILQKLLQIWTDLQQFQANQSAILVANPDIQIKVFDQFNELSTHFQEVLSWRGESIDSSTKQTILDLTNGLNDSQTISQQIATFSLQRCNETIEFVEKCEQNQSQSQLCFTHFSTKEIGIGESYYRLAIFCLKHLGSTVNQLEMSKLLIKSILRGMKHDSKNARLQFPRLLQLPDINTKELSDLFRDEANRVPLWTYIGSITQIMSRFDFKNPCFLDNLLLGLATTYPSIVIYSFQLSFGNFCEHNPNSNVRPVVQQIIDAVANPLTKQFIESIKCLSLPEKVIQHHLYSFINKSPPNANHQQQLNACYENIFENPLRGKSTDKVQQFKNDFQDMLAMFDQSEQNQIRDAAKKLLDKLKKLVTAKHKSTDKLNVFSPWLAEYHWYGASNYLALPGQYTGNVPPNSSTSLKIVKFSETVSICHSLRKPVKISAICSDGKSYSFLVKYGEDLRQDDRIQHVQKLMSDQMQLDRNCSQQKLSLRTYRVIPLNTNCGLISWIEGTDSIQSFLSANDSKWFMINSGIRKKFEDFIAKSNKKSEIPSNINAVLHCPPQEIAQHLKKLTNILPETGLRNALYKLSASPECFFVLRNNFGKSLAAISIAHWVLGIGDRNLGNFLIDKSNGNLIGIDFHMAFGAATRNLNIPELVPFRLTTQFVNALKPLETSGFLAKGMGHVLRTFRLENESLMAALEVFIHEPTADHENSFNRSSTSSQGTFNSSAEPKASRPEQHLKTIKDKLSGINPTIPIQNDIKVSYYSCDADVVSAYSNLIAGLPTTYRRRVQKENMRVEEQVKCLIDIASDLSILGVSFVGFQPWI